MNETRTTPLERDGIATATALEPELAEHFDLVGRLVNDVFAKSKSDEPKLPLPELIETDLVGL